MISNENQEIIDRLKHLRCKHNLSQAKFAKLIGASQGNVASWETGKTFPSAIALRNIALNLKCSVDWILLGDLILDNKPIDLPSKQKKEVILDPDLKMMIDILKDLMESGDPDLRGWAKIQFKSAFKELCASHEDEKKHA